MTDFMRKLSIKIASSDEYMQASNVLFDSYIKDALGETTSMDRQQVKNLTSAAQVFYKSDDKKHRKEGAILLSMLLDTCANSYPDIVPIANSVFVESGDFPNIQLLTRRHPDLKYGYSVYSEAQHDFRRQLNSVDELDFTLTDYQRSLWRDLATDNDVITSAPTSAGKTHIILNYLLDMVMGSDGSFAAIIVPTRALISEVAGKVYALAEALGYSEELEICTVPKDGEFKEKTFFVMTQERLYEVLMKGDISFNYFFLDEAHNIADKSRGVLLHLTIEKMLDDSNPQIIISMPSSSYQNSFSTVFKGVDFIKEISDNSPVSKVIMSVTPKGRDLVISRKNSTDEVRISKGFTGVKLANIVHRLGHGQSNIIYRNRTDYCEQISDGISKLITDYEQNDLLEEAADYVEKFIHEGFSLAENLRKGAAFHYGPLPSSIRVMIENLVKEGHINYIACTSTLAEGVNLPAKNLFLQNPVQPRMMKSSVRIEDVKINNITGRAGRMLEHFSGNIFLIEPEKWDFPDYFEEKDDTADKIPTYFKTLNEELSTVIGTLRGSGDHEEGDQFRFYSIANKLIKEFSNDELDFSLSAEELTLTHLERSALTHAVEDAYKNLKVPAFTLEANPTTGYIQQNEVFKFMMDLEDYGDWILPHPKAGTLFDTLLKVCELLQDKGVFIPSEDNTLKHICGLSKKWIQGVSLKEMITDQIRWESQRKDSSGSVNRSVRNVIKVINNDIGFRLSNALRCYDVLLSNVLLSKGIELTSVKLHALIEIGACDERMINLINTGMSREAAKELHDALPAGAVINSPDDIVRLLEIDRAVEIHPVTRKEISKLFKG
ncbi:DEAD/DEAH box helicase [Pseudophaeobacter sp.]|uniref:DEAD/DEAH box helicase n=1 Tax=Pseudophaeobacter sp. TaxID=1971739 RepID=UPI003297F41C